MLIYINSYKERITLIKLRLGNTLLPLAITTVLLLLVISFVPNIVVLRLVLGLPFLLFFPGYALILALISRRGVIKGIERAALSFGLSFAIVAIIGIGLNYTPWGLRLTPALFSTAGFILAMSGVAWLRQRKLPKEDRYTVDIQVSSPHTSNPLNRMLMVLMALVILGAAGILLYALTLPKEAGGASEFYLLGREGMANNYPKDFVLSQGQIVSVDYGNGPETGQYGQLILGIINDEQAEATYEITLTINGQPAQIYSNGVLADNLGPTTLQSGEKWEQEIGFAPTTAGSNQEVVFNLLLNGQPYFDSPPHLWINVTSQS